MASNSDLSTSLGDMRGLGRGEADVDFLGLALGLTSSAHCFGTCQQMKVVNVSNFLPKFYTFSEYMKTLAYVKHNYLLHALIFRMCVIVYILLIHLHSTNMSNMCTMYMCMGVQHTCTHTMCCYMKLNALNS